MHLLLLIILLTKTWKIMKTISLKELDRKSVVNTESFQCKPTCISRCKQIQTIASNELVKKEYNLENILGWKNLGLAILLKITCNV